MLQRFLVNLRPAPLASLVATVLRLNKRRFVRTEHGTFYINPASDFGSAICTGGHDAKTRNVLSCYLPPGGVFIDLGAHEGYFTVLGSKLVGPRGTVIAVEPQSRLHQVIQTNLEANECFNVRLIRCALSGETGKTRIWLAPETNIGSSSLFRQTRYPLPTEAVPTFSLADLIERIGADRCDLMKVDIESSEYEVFMAAGAVLKSGIIRNIAIEIHNSMLQSRGLSGDRLHHHILEHGYRLNTELGAWVYNSVA